MINIKIVSIPHKNHRYETCGDWYTADNLDLIEVSEMQDERMSFLIAIHEMVEQFLCKQRDISEERVTAFDKKFEKERKKGTQSVTAEPGDDKRSPYRREHFFATSIERLIAAEIGVDWQKYELEIEGL